MSHYAMATTTSRPITRKTASCVPLQVGVGIPVTWFRTEASRRQAWPVRLCNRPLGRHWLVGRWGAAPPPTFHNRKANHARRLPGGVLRTATAAQILTPPDEPMAEMIEPCEQAARRQSRTRPPASRPRQDNEHRRQPAERTCRPRPELASADQVLHEARVEEPMQP